jgi:hypothetical protein
LPFLKFLSTYPYILHWIYGISSKCCLSLPRKMHWVYVYICPPDCSSPCDIFFYFILFNFLVWFIVSCIVCSGRLFNKWWTVKGFQGSSHDLISHYSSICFEKLKKTM